MGMPSLEDMIGDVEVPAAEVVPSKEMAMIGGAFDGASRFDAEVALWQPPLASADLDLIPEKPYIDARVRDSVRNDGYVAAGQRIHQDNIVGSHFVLNAKPNLAVLGLDEVWAAEFQAETEAKFQTWADSIENWCDKTRALNFTQMVRMGVALLVSTGEILASGEWMTDGRPCNTAIQLIDSDRLSNPWGQFNNPLLRMGVEKNADGVAVAYHIRKAHPADFTTFASFNAFAWDRIPARKPWGRTNIIHIVERNRVDQSRGISMMVSALKEMRMTKRYRDVVLQNAVVNATYAATIESDLPSEVVMAQLGAGGMTEGAASAGITNYAAGYLSAVGKYMAGSQNTKIDGVKVPHLFPGTTLKLQPAGGGDAMGGLFEASLLRHIAASLDVSYEQLSRDYGNVNYASFRAAANEIRKGMQARKKHGADRFATYIHRLWLEESMNAGEITSMSKKAPEIYDSRGKLGLMFDAYSEASWIGGSQGQIDELKETQAASQRIIFGLSTYEDEHARLGKDFRKVFAQISRERKELEERGILLNVTSDMVNATTGTLGQEDDGKAAPGLATGAKGSK